MDRTCLPTFFLSHGGGPWPYIKEMRSQFAKTVLGFSNISKNLPEQPIAILMISGHWQETEFRVSSAELPKMEYDYSGFPEHTYHISYPAPGSPHLAQRIINLLEKANIPCSADPDRGFDHGIFVPMVIMYPQAQIPIVSLSIKSSYSPSEHIRLGQALLPLRKEGILIIGSGLTYHNLHKFGSTEAGLVSKIFEGWLNSTISETDIASRNRQLVNWSQAPEARKAHPREDHFMPLLAIAGAAGDSIGRRILLDKVWNVTMGSYRFG